MKQSEYREGPEAQEIFERGMKALFKIPKADIVQRETAGARRKLFLPRDGAPSKLRLGGVFDLRPLQTTFDL